MFQTDTATYRMRWAGLHRQGAILALAVSMTLGAATAPGAAQGFDCSFFREHAVDRHDLDYSARMLAACEALAAYREKLLRENVRYAFGEKAAADREVVLRRAAPLDTFHVLSEMEQYRIAREAQVFEVIIEIP